MTAEHNIETGENKPEIKVPGIKINKRLRRLALKKRANMSTDTRVCRRMLKRADDPRSEITWDEESRSFKIHYMNAPVMRVHMLFSDSWSSCLSIDFEDGTYLSSSSSVVYDILKDVYICKYARMESGSHARELKQERDVRLSITSILLGDYKEYWKRYYREMKMMGL